MGSRALGLALACCLLLAFACGLVLGRVPRGQEEQQEQEGTKDPPLDHTERAEEKHEKYSPRQGDEPSASRCFRCCDPGTPVYQAIPVPQINITILKGEKGDRGDRGLQGKYGRTGSMGARGHMGPKGQKGSMGAPGDQCKNHYAAFSVGRKKPLHSNDYYQTVIFDTEFVNLYGHFNMFTGKFYCYVPGVYFFSLNVHTWNQKETYLHIMKNGEEVVILYAQVSDRSIMQSQSLMLELRDQDEVWVRLFKGERENAIFSDEFDTYITFSGYSVGLPPVLPLPTPPRPVGPLWSSTRPLPGRPSLHPGPLGPHAPSFGISHDAPPRSGNLQRLCGPRALPCPQMKSASRCRGNSPLCTCP
uniref:Complement C1q tumor necrosis factor-related protein 1 n=1 Tax=Camelus bactrianus TaxID=9837 RepID=A0A9W3FZW1_CAMBA|nr:complement C1q tumor necrosis factor-related protein 1 [Camelus bactrianus]XP_045369471.1 complement C1q tumor necrosis factor-related protein 1 [Camelus bactrianus]XP_045369473.1 complement C1q tumor necrosis factor-related protein 1 [Camelus bactrianus]